MITNSLRDSEVKDFLEYCHKIYKQRSYAFYLENDSVWNKEKKHKFQVGIVGGLFFEENPILINLLSKRCNHDELKHMLEHYRDEYQNSDIALLAKKYNTEYQYPEIKEPLEKWIYEVNYLLAYPVAGDFFQKDEKVFIENPEKILTYVYLNLKHKEYEKNHAPSLFKQENIERVYNRVFDKTSSFKTYGLIPIDNERTLHSLDEPVRIFDHEIDKTIFLQVPRPLAIVLQELIEKKYIKEIAFRGDDQFIYEGENHCSSLEEAVEVGKVFDLNITLLPEMSKLVSDSNYDDSLWISVNETDVTFEELCDDINIEENSVMTQVVHLQYEGHNITHIDHEYIFYSIEEYEERQLVRRKGKGGKKFKTFKVDKALIPFDYDCQMLSSDEREIKVPFIYFVLNAYFVHKDLLKEYFQRILERKE